MASRESIERSSSEFGGSGVLPLETEIHATNSFAGIDEVDAHSSTDESTAIFDRVLQSDVKLNFLFDSMCPLAHPKV